jgi:outer membrane protein TolC
MRNIGLVFWGLFFFFPGFTQTDKPVTLEDCYEWAEAAYPLREKTPLLEQGSRLRIEQIRSERLPTLETGFQASWQSEVVEFPFDLPPALGDPLDLPLYRAQASVTASYLIYDGGLAKARVAQERTRLAAEKQNVTVELSRLRETVNQLFFGILLLGEKQAILEVTYDNLLLQREKLDAGIRNGVVLPSAHDQLTVEIIRVRAQLTEQFQMEKGLRQQLADLTGKFPDDLKSLKAPEFPLEEYPLPLQRPELAWIDLQKASVEQGEDLIHAARMPKVSAFATGGLGYPNPLNFFDEEIAPYAMAGIQAKWTIYDWGKQQRDRELLTVQQLILDNQRQVLETNLDRADAHFLQQITSLEQQILFDKQIAELQAKLLQTISAQLDNGVATTTDYLLQSNAETLARLQLKTHEIQLAQVKAAYRVHRGHP